TLIEPWQRERVPQVMAYAEDRVRRVPAPLPGRHPTRHDPPHQTGPRPPPGGNGHPAPRAPAPPLHDHEDFFPTRSPPPLRHHADHPDTSWVGGPPYTVSYLPAESDTGMFGGNSNWRGPVWMPINVLLIRALVQLYGYYGDKFRIECPTGSGQQMTLYEVANE